MRGLLIALAAMGGLLILLSVSLLLDHLMTDDHRARIGAEVADRIEDVQDSMDQGMIRAVDGASALENAILTPVPLNMKWVMPRPGAPWRYGPYETAHGEAITRTTMTRNRFMSTGTTDDRLKALARVRRGHKLSRATTYAIGDRMAVLWFEASMSDLRILDTGRAEDVTRLLTPVRHKDPWRTVYTLDGIPVAEHPPWAEVYPAPSSFDEKTRAAVPYRYLTFAIGSVARGTILTNLRANDLATLLGQIDMARMQAGLPRPTTDYRPRTGLRQSSLNVARAD